MNCLDCKHCVVVSDPDKFDWFCDDDEAVLCGLSPNETSETYWASGKPMEHRPITKSCRPYNKRKESETPSWCPKDKE